MTKFVADQNSISFLYESGTYGTVSGTRQWIGEVQDVTPDDNTNIFAVRYQGAADRDVSQFVDGPEDHTLSLNYYPQDWKMMAFALGSNVDGGTTPKTHTMTEINNDQGNGFISGTDVTLPSFTIEACQKASTGLNFIRTLNGCVVNSLTLNASQGEILTCDLNLIGQTNTFSSGAISYATEAGSRPFLWKDVLLHLPSGTVVSNLNSVTFSLDNGLVAPHYLNGSAQVAVPTGQNREYELGVTVDANTTWTKSFYDQYFLGGSTFNALLVISHNATREAFITMSGCKVMKMDAPQGIEGTNAQTITIKPRKVNMLAEDGITSYNPW